MRFSWKDKYYSVRNFFFPRQRWLLKALPKHWTDKDEVIRLCLYQCIVHFIEDEKCFEVIDWNYTAEQQEAKKKILEIYDWIKTGRPKLERDYWNSYPEAGQRGTYDELYKEVNRLEALIDIMDTGYLTWIVENRRFLWT